MRTIPTGFSIKMPPINAKTMAKIPNSPPSLKATINEATVDIIEVIKIKNWKEAGKRGKKAFTISDVF